MLEKVIKIVREASDLFKNRDFQIDNKGSNTNHVTSVDVAVQKFLKERLVELIGGCGFIGEESSVNEYEKEYLWVVDPIDGTANFIRDMGYSAISVGLVKDNKSILGVIYNPYRDELYYAESGKGAFLNGKQIHVSENSISQSIFCTAMSLYDKNYAKPCFNIIEKVYKDCEDIRRMGSAVLELASLACGRVDLYFEIRVFPWDFAAAEIIIKEAGGYVGTIEYNNTIFNRPIPLICANSKENFDYLKGIVLEEIPTIPYKE